MAKKNFNELLQQTREEESKIDVTESAKELLSKATTGEKTKDKFIKIRVTEEERSRWNEYAKKHYRTLSDLIREMLEERIKTDR